MDLSRAVEKAIAAMIKAVNKGTCTKEEGDLFINHVRSLLKVDELKEG